MPCEWGTTVRVIVATRTPNAHTRDTTSTQNGVSFLPQPATHTHPRACEIADTPQGCSPPRPHRGLPPDKRVPNKTGAPLSWLLGLAASRSPHAQVPSAVWPLSSLTTCCEGRAASAIMQGPALKLSAQTSQSVSNSSWPPPLARTSLSLTRHHPPS